MVGGVLAPNGNIYGIPSSGNTDQFILLQFNPETRVVDTASVSYEGQWYGGVLGSNGKIYGIPYFNSNILEIDPVSFSPRLVSFSDGQFKTWKGGALSSNGKIYAAPGRFGNDKILIIDTNKSVPTTSDISFAAQSVSPTYSYNGSISAPDGKIYGIPANTNAPLLEFNPDTEDVDYITIDVEHQGRFSSGVLAQNGKIYALPSEGTKVLHFKKTFPQVVNDGIFILNL